MINDMLFILDMANNHQGDIEHGLRIVEEAANIQTAKPYCRIAVKLQYRQLATFISKSYQGQNYQPNASNWKYVNRFKSTELSPDELLRLVEAIKNAGMPCIVTPFDEPSVQLCREHAVDILKVASCSANDWSLLRAVSDAQKPVIASTGGHGLRQIDKLVNFFEHRSVSQLTLMHCVSVYPTPLEQANLSFLKKMQRRYKQPIGYSGHENPTEVRIAQAAVACGCKVLERHFGVNTGKYKLNAYSMTPGQTVDWINAVQVALEIQGCESEDKIISEPERNSIRALSRGVFASCDINKGSSLSDKIYYAFPPETGQTLASEFDDSIIASKDYLIDEPIVDKSRHRIYEMRSVIHEAKGLLREGNVHVNDFQSIELSHHYGMERFRDCGALIINVVNREYCKKIIVCLGGQRHPLHYHQKKEETFRVLHGTMVLELENEDQTSIVLHAGDQFLVQRGMIHGWRSAGGCVFEEISTTHVSGDSYYQDNDIAQLDPVERKTIIDQW